MEEYLGRKIKFEKRYGRLKGIIPTPNCDVVTQHSFVDDTIFVGKVGIREVKIFKKIMDT